MKQFDRPAAWVESVVQSFCNSSENTLQNPAQERAWEDPLVGFSSGADPLYEQYKEVVGPFHWTPSEALTLAWPGIKVEPQDLTVISWVLPQTEATRADNRKETVYPAERWARSRIFGEEFNVKLRKHMVKSLKQQGYEAVAPLLLPQWQTRDSDRYVISSVWSERHAAYASGLGTFGLCDGLITPKGKAVRIGTVVARLQIPPTARPYTDHHAYCLYFTEGICSKCIERCPVGAITQAGHDKTNCRQHLKPVTENYVKSNFGFDGYGCGLCQTGVPCENKIPTEQDLL
jgi:epoxyqueuosine reductase